MSGLFSRSLRLRHPSCLIIQSSACGRSTLSTTALSLESKRPEQNNRLREAKSDTGSEQGNYSPDNKATPPEVDIFDKHSPSYWRKDKTLPNYKRHKLAIKEKLNGQTWQPRHRLSREAMDHMKQLAREDPMKWTAETLAVMYKKSPEAVRRILKSNYVRNTRTKRMEEDIEEDWEMLNAAATARMRTLSNKSSDNRQVTNPSKRTPQFFSGYTVNKHNGNKRK